MDESRVKNISSQCVSSNIIFCYILLSLSLIVALGINGQFCGDKSEQCFET